jgi:glyoxylase-like metal-dependent hydrolase (beta-lactamase superfamily II)
MAIHHLNCGTLCPYGGRLLGGEDGFGAVEMCCHCLLIESGDSLVLVDTGFGTDDVAHPYRRLGAPFAAAFRPRAELGETAVSRIRELGLDPADVRHIAVTHLDLDHAGGLPDFPDAEVHAFAPEVPAATQPALRDRARYRPPHFAHGPRFVEHAVDGDAWFGFQSVRLLPDTDPEIVLVPLPGHSRGHSAIAVRDGDGWLLHCGDAYFYRGEVSTPPSCPRALRMFQTAIADDNGSRVANQERLRELAREHGDEVRLVCAHDPVEFARERAR